MKFKSETYDWASWKSRLISADWIVPPRRIIDLFENRPQARENGRMFRIKRVWTVKSNPWRRRLCDVYVPAFLYHDIFTTDNKDIAILEWVLNHPEHGYRLKNYRETIHPWICDAHSAKYLQIAVGEPIFQVTWKFYTKNEELLWLSEDLTTASTIHRNVKIVGLKKEKK